VNQGKITLGARDEEKVKNHCSKQKFVKFWKKKRKSGPTN